MRGGLIALSRGFCRIRGIFVEGAVVGRRRDLEQGEVVWGDEGLALVLASRIQTLQCVGAIIFKVAGIRCAKIIVVRNASSVYWIVCSSNERAGEAGTSNAGHGLAVEASPESFGVLIQPVCCRLEVLVVTVCDVSCSCVVKQCDLRRRLLRMVVGSQLVGEWVYAGRKVGVTAWTPSGHVHVPLSRTKQTLRR
jgi:hypothetical protein